jgi:hypothetical protein
VVCRCVSVCACVGGGIVDAGVHGGVGCVSAHVRVCLPSAFANEMGSLASKLSSLSVDWRGDDQQRRWSPFPHMHVCGVYTSAGTAHTPPPALLPPLPREWAAEQPRLATCFARFAGPVMLIFYELIVVTVANPASVWARVMIAATAAACMAFISAHPLVPVARRQPRASSSRRGASSSDPGTPPTTSSSSSSSSSSSRSSSSWAASAAEAAAVGGAVLATDAAAPHAAQGPLPPAAAAAAAAGGLSDWRPSPYAPGEEAGRGRAAGDAGVGGEEEEEEEGPGSLEGSVDDEWRGGRAGRSVDLLLGETVTKSVDYVADFVEAVDQRAKNMVESTGGLAQVREQVCEIMC